MSDYPDFIQIFIKVTSGLLCTVVNNSYHFWADLLYKWLYLGIMNIDPKCHAYLLYVLTNFSWAKSHNRKIKIHLVIQHLLNHVPFYVYTPQLVGTLRFVVDWILKSNSKENVPLGFFFIWSILKWVFLMI